MVASRCSDNYLELLSCASKVLIFIFSLDCLDVSIELFFAHNEVVLDGTSQHDVR